MENEMEKKSGHRPGWRKKFLIGFAILLSPLIIFLGWGFYLNHRPLPRELMQPPTYLGRAGKASANVADHGLIELKTQEPLKTEGQEGWPEGFSHRTVMHDYQSAMVKGEGRQARRWKPGEPLDTTQTAMIRRYRPLLDRIYQDGRKSDLFFVGYTQIRDRQGKTLWSGQTTIIDNWLFNLIAADGWLAASEGRQQDAARAFASLYQIVDQMTAQSVYWQGVFIQATQATTAWIGAFVPPPDVCHWMLDELAPSAKELLAPEIALDAFRQDLASQREALLHDLSGPWYSPVYGWHYQDHPDQYFMVAGSPDLMLPRPIFIANQALECMRRKQHPERIVQIWDDHARQWLEWANRDDASHRDGNAPTYPDSFREIGLPSINFTAICDESSIPLSQTEFNLNRAALAWLADPKSRPADGAVDFHRDPAHPWRDPYSEQPFHMDQTETATLIYSIGPDHKDQHGRVAYAPTNKAHVGPTEGDLAIWIKKP